MSRGKKRGNLDLLGKYTWFLPTTADFLIIIGLFILGTVIGNLLALLAMMVPGVDMSMANIIAYPMMFIPAMIYAGAKSQRDSYNHEGILYDNKNFAPLGGWLCAGLAVLLTLCMAFCADTFSLILPEPSEQFEQAMEGIMESEHLWASFISACIFAPFFEEWLCRGTVLRGLVGRGMKPGWAIVISAAFFAIIHLNPWQAAAAFALGLLIGYVYYKTGSLRLCMLMHFTNNITALVISNIESLKEYDTFLDLLGPMYWIFFAAAVIILALGVLKFKKTDSALAMPKVPAIFEKEI